MVVAFDTDILSLMFLDSIEPPLDPITRRPVRLVRDRIRHLVDQLNDSGTQIVVPAPAFAEFLVVAGDGSPDVIELLSGQAPFSIEPFDSAAAIEAAASTRTALMQGDKRSGATGTWQCIKADRQIAAVAKLNGAETIYSNDSDMQRIASLQGIQVVPVWDLPCPPEQD